jgi:hypothetical protein
LIIIRAINGTEVAIDENAVTLVCGPYPHDVGPHTYVHGADRSVLVTAEPAVALVARLGVKASLARLTRPDGTPVWIKASAVNEMRPPLGTEQQGGGVVKAVLVIGDLHQAVREEVAAASAILKRVTEV